MSPGENLSAVRRNVFDYLPVVYSYFPMRVGYWINGVHTRHQWRIRADSIRGYGNSAALDVRRIRLEYAR